MGLLIPITMRLLILVVVGLLCCASAISNCQSGEYSKTYIVKADDTCWSIAQANGITLADLEKGNPNVHCSNLQIGEVLCVAESGVIPQNLQSCTTYTVKAGDICWDIAQAHGITVAQLEQWNPGLQCSSLQIGQVLCVSDPGGSPTASPPPPAPPTGNCVTYVVKAGDICWDIAQAYGITVAQLEQWNPGLQCSNLQIGQVLCVSEPGGSPTGSPPPPPPPTGNCVTYTVQAGDSCWDISQAHGISLDDFVSWNPNIQCSNLRIGQSVCVSPPGSVPPAPPPPPADYNGNVFMEYIGAIHNGVKFSDVPINTNVAFHFILAFAIDYTTEGGISPTNGIFNIYWQKDVLTPDAVRAIKAQYSNVKVMVSLGGDTVQGQHVLFSPTTVESWVSNAVDSLARLIDQFDLDGIDINYERFASDTTPETFASCIQQLITQLKERGLISVASIAPFDPIETPYLQLWKDYSELINFVNFQFYTYPPQTTAAEYANLYAIAAAKYGGGSKLMASFNTFPNIGPPPANVLEACRMLQSNGRLPGIFVWSADHSRRCNFVYDIEAQALLAGEADEKALYSVA